MRIVFASTFPYYVALDAMCGVVAMLSNSMNGKMDRPQGGKESPFEKKWGLGASVDRTVRRPEHAIALTTKPTAATELREQILNSYADVAAQQTAAIRDKYR